MSVTSVVKPEEISPKDTVVSFDDGVVLQGEDPIIIVEHGGIYVKMPLSELIASIYESRELYKDPLFQEALAEYKNKKSEFLPL